MSWSHINYYVMRLINVLMYGESKGICYFPAMGVNLPAHLVIIKNTQQYVNGAYQVSALCRYRLVADILLCNGTSVPC